MQRARARSVTLSGFLLTSEEWEDEDLRLALLSAFAEKASAAADLDSYDSFELIVERTVDHGWHMWS
jgi:hypothetical protein